MMPVQNESQTIPKGADFMVRSRVSFGMIVLNGEPFTRYNLQALYPFAHQIIVVEGACPGAASVATADGHSTDGTLEVLHRFSRENDPERKLIIVTAEDEGKANGFWSEKDEMSQAYAKRATGDWLWQVDVDEFYQPEHMEAVLAWLAREPGIQMVTFRQTTFWGDLDTWVDGFLLRRASVIFYHRLFQWGPGYSYASHRPPTVLNEKGESLYQGRVLRGEDLAKRNIILYHYSLLFPQQVENKSAYYENAQWCQAHGAKAWAAKTTHNILDPFRVHRCTDFVSWLEEFHGQHPPAIIKMWSDVVNGQIDAARRPMDDVHDLKQNRRFRAKRALLRVLAPMDALLYRTRAAWAAFRRRHGILTPRVPGP